MLTWLVASAMRMRRLVLAGVVAVLALAVVQLDDASLDVYPEFEPPAVTVQTEALGLSAEEVENLITSPLEQDLLNGIPWLSSIRSQSMPGLSSIDLTFDDGTDLYLARQMVQERMSQAAALPNVGAPPQMIQPTASTSRVAMVALTSDDVSPIEMSVLARWQLRPRLMAIPGVAQVSIWGQRDRQLQVQVDPARLQSSGVTLTQLIETTGNALWVSPLSFVEASTPGTGGFVETPNQRIGVQHVSPITSSDQLADIAIEGVQGPPLRLGDVADVIEDHPPLIGDARTGGEQSLLMVVERFPDADVGQVTDDVEDALAAMAPGLTGITVDSDIYRPADYLSSAAKRLGVAAGIGLLLMLLVVGLLSRSWRTPLIALIAVPTSLGAALLVLTIGGAPLTTMTLLGLAAVVAIVLDDVLGGAATAVRRGPLAYATVAALVALVPLLFLREPAGAFVRPALLTFLLAAVASFLVALVVTPVLSALLGGRGRAVASSPARRATDRWAGEWLGRPLPAVLTVAVLLALTLAGLPQLASGSLLPDLADRNALVRLEAAPGTSLAEMDRITTTAAVELRELPGVASAASHVGRAIGADEVVDVDAGEIWLTIDRDADAAETLDAIRTTVLGYPGLHSEVRSYADDRLTAVSTDTGDALVVRVSGEDYPVLQEQAEHVRDALRTVEGVVAPQVEPLVSQPTVAVEVDLAAAQRYDLRPGDVRREVSTLVSGLTVGSLYEQQAIFDVVLWGGPPTRATVEGVRELLVHTPGGAPVRLGDVADVRIEPTPTVIAHDGVSRSLTVTAEVRGRGAADVAADATARLRQMTFADDYRAEVVGDAVDRADAQRRVLLAVLAAVAVVFLLIQAATNGWRSALALAVTVPTAAGGALLAAGFVGGAWSAGVLAAAFSVTVLALRQSLVLVRRAQALHAEGADAPEALRAAVREQAPSTLVVGGGAAALVLPAAVLGGPGLELLQEFAVALIGGLVTATVVVLLAVPAVIAAVGGLRPPPQIGPDTPDGELPQPAAAPLAPHTDAVVPGGTAVRTHRTAGMVSLLLAAGFGLTACQAVSADTEPGTPPAVAEADPGGGPSRLTVTEEARGRLGIETASVAGRAGDLRLPYAAVVYDAEGGAWTFVELEPGVYRRAPIAVTAIDGDEARLSDGPEPGTAVVTVGAAELVGVEAGISGGE